MAQQLFRPQVWEVHRYIAPQGGGKSPKGILTPIVDFASAVAAPFTGGASLAIPFAMTGVNDAITGNWNNLPLQLAGDAAAAVPFGIGEAFGPSLSGLGAAGGAADMAGTGAGSAFGSAFGSTAGDFLGGAGGSAFGSAMGAGAGSGISDFLSGAGDAVAGGAGGFGGDFGSTFGSTAGDFLGAGGTPSLGGVTPNSIMPQVSPVASLGGTTPDVMPAGAGGSAVTAADPFGVGGVGTGEDTVLSLGPPPASSNIPSVFGGDPVGAAAAGGGGGTTGTSAFGTMFGTEAGQDLADPFPSLPGAAGPSGSGSAFGDAMGAQAGFNMGSADQGLFGGVSRFLSDNKNLISLGTGAFGVGNAIYKNMQAQQGLDLLTQQAQQAQMFASQFQNNYNQLFQQAQPLIQAGMNGQLTPQQAANVFASANRMKQEIAAKYASMGQTGGTNEQQDLNNVDLIIAGLQQSLSMSTLAAGINLLGGASSTAGLNGGMNSAIAQLARYNMGSDQDLTQALTGFAKAAGQAA